MPYSIHKKGDKFAVVKKDGGEQVGETDSEEKAKAMIRAIYANERLRKQ